MRAPFTPVTFAAVALLLAGAALVHGCALVAGIQDADTSASKQHCIDGKRDADEVDIDCGGNDCGACGGAACTQDSDCQSGSCASGKCAEPTCSDGVWDGYESSLDCGDPRGALIMCTLCAVGEHCWNGCNCDSGFCDPSSSTCQSGTPNCDMCADGVKDGTETGVDCGGTCATMKGKPCPDGAGCTVDADCMAGHHCDMTTCGP